jgi:hypothetical protein
MPCPTARSNDKEPSSSWISRLALFMSPLCLIDSGRASSSSLTTWCTSLRRAAASGRATEAAAVSEAGEQEGSRQPMDTLLQGIEHAPAPHLLAPAVPHDL